MKKGLKLIVYFCLNKKLCETGVLMKKGLKLLRIGVDDTDYVRPESL